MTEQNEYPESGRVRTRVLGTPPADAPIVDSDPIHAPEGVPGVIPQDPVKARKAERLVALLFLITFLAGRASSPRT